MRSRQGNNCATFGSVLKQLIFLVCLLVLSSEVKAEPRVTTSKINVEVKHSAAMQLTDHLLDHPRVEVAPWWLSIIGCSTCESIYTTIFQYIKGKDIVKAWKGGLHVLCLFWHDEQSCMRYVETYHNLIMMDLFKGPLGRNFTCSAVFKVCASPYMKNTLRDFITNKTSTFKLPILQNDDYLNSRYTNEISYKQENLVTYQILHLSDLNVDINYVAGSSANCR